MSYKDHQKRINQYYSISPIQYTVVESITLRQQVGSNGEMEQLLSIVLKELDSPEAQAYLYIDFYGIKGLKIKQPSLSLVTIGHLEIRMAPTSTGYVRGNYYVLDSSQEEVIQFFCSDFDFALSD